MKLLRRLGLFSLFCAFAAHPAVRAQTAQPPGATPSGVKPGRYRDFKVYATSRPDPQSPLHVLATVQLHNEGTRPLQLRAQLAPNARAGFSGGTKEFTLLPGATALWEVGLRPVEGLTREVLTGSIVFARSRTSSKGRDSLPAEATLADRELYIALQGPDPAGLKDIELDGAAYWEGNIGPDPVYTQRQGIRRITSRAEVVGVHAPLATPADWMARVAGAGAQGVGATPSDWRSQVVGGVNSRRPSRSVLTLATAGRTRYRIVVEPMPRAVDGSELSLEAWGALKPVRPGEPELAAAVADLQRCLTVMSGATLPVVSEPPAGSRAIAGPAIRLRLNAGRAWPHGDAYHLFTRGDDVIIESGHLDGLRQGIYGLLTDHLGCRWFAPGRMGEEIPRPAGKRVTLARTIDEQKQPSFASVGGMSGGAHRDWDRRNRTIVNRGRMSFGHAWWSYISSREFPYDKFPDMWARDRAGKIRQFDTGYSFTNFCPTSPEVIEIVARKVNERLRNPDTLVASLDPNDYAPHCLCDRCLAVDRSYGVTDQKGTYVTDRLLHFSKEIYNRLEPANKDKYLGVLAYAHHIELPRSAVPHARHTSIICNMDWVYDHTRPFTDPTSPQNAAFQRQLQGWSKLVPNLGFYDYYGHYRLFGPWGIIHKMREELPAFHAAGGDYLMIEAQPNFGMHGLNLYIASRLAWDVNTDVDAAMDEYFVRYYGPAAEPMRRYWLAIERRYALARPGPDAIDRVTANPEIWQELDGYLKAAEALVGGADQRFKDRLTFHRDGFEWGRRQHEFIRIQAQPDAALDAQKIGPYVQSTQAWLEEKKTKYKASEGYWPTLIASYLYSGTEVKLKELENRAK